MSPFYPRVMLAVLFATACLLAQNTSGDDLYVVKSLASLKIVEGKLPKYLVPQYSFWGQPSVRVAISGPGEAVIGTRAGVENGTDSGTFHVAVRIPNARDIEGKIISPGDDDLRKLQICRFKIPAAELIARRDQFLQVRLAHYTFLAEQNLPGAAWFRHEVRETSKALGIDLKNEGANRSFSGPSRGGLEDTFALFSGGRAVSENLQLDRELPTSKPASESVSLVSLGGITTKEFDWTPLIKDVSPQVDPLARLIPGDQHALFFPSFAALTQAMDLAKQHGTPFLQLTESRGESAQTQELYQQQMCLPLGQVDKLLGPQLVSSIAITGGDPYFRTGTDVAVLLESKSVNALRQLLQARITQICTENPDAKTLNGQILGAEYFGARTPDRRICTYVSHLGDVVVVANSPGQLQRVFQIQKSAAGSLAQEPEYTFFRHRYPRGEDHELAFLILTDKTIRRWCGPKWRIATSRRTRAAAVLSDIQARHADLIVHGKVQPADVPSEFWYSDGESQSLGTRGATSTLFGNLRFQTPIAELEFDSVTAEEARFYERWRDSYQRNWSNFFDPIAIRFSNTKQKLTADVTVMPLIDNSEYNLFVGVAKGAQIGTAGDPHAETLAHVALAINPDSSLLKQYAPMLAIFAPQVKINPLSWLGNAVALYVDQDPIWLEAAKSDSPEKFLEKNHAQIPVAFHAEVRNGLKLAAFLVGVRAFVEQSGPGLTAWETLEHRETPYVKVSATERARGQTGLPDLAIFYCASGESLVITPNEALLKRAIDRQLDRKNGPDDGKRSADIKWLGDSLCLRLDGQFHKVLASLFHDDYQRITQIRSYSNIPILNEWKKRYSELDPVRVHEILWSRRLICPAGEYRWNEEWQTMESTVYGHPGEPKTGPDLPAAFMDYSGENFGVTFEEHGLRARMELTRRAE